MQHCHKYVQCAYYHFPNTFICYLTTRMSTNYKQKMAGLFIYNLQNFQICLPHFSKRNHFGIKSCSYQSQKPAFLLNTRKTCSNIELLCIFSQTFFGTNFRVQKKWTMLFKQSAALLTSYQKNVAYITCSSNFCEQNQQVTTRTGFTKTLLPVADEVVQHIDKYLID